MSENNTGFVTKPVLGSVVSGGALGLLLGFPAIFAAVISSGAGHGHYVAARALFPTSMLLTLVEGSIGALSISVALLQFPIYGALLGWTLVRENRLPALAVGLLHVVAAIACFAGTLPNFS